MSIASEITSIGENLKKDYQAIANLGADLTNVDKNIENIAELLDGVYDNLPKTEYQEGTEVNLGITSKGKLDYDNGVVGIGQSSQDSTNGYQLINNPNFADVTNNSVTVHRNTDGSYTLTGTSTGFAVVKLSQALTLDNGVPYYVSGGINENIGIDIRDNSLNSYGTRSTSPTTIGSYTPSSSMSDMYVCVRVPSGTATNVTIYPMISKSNTYNWEKYTGRQASPNPSYPQEIKYVRGKNIFNISSAEYFMWLYTNGQYGVSTDPNLLSEFIKVQKGQNYVFSGIPSAYSIRVCSYTTQNVSSFKTCLINNLSNVYDFTADADYIRFAIGNADTRTLDKIQLEEGSTSTPYLPYNTIEVVVSGKNYVEGLELGEINAQTGAESSASNIVRLKNYIPYSKLKSYRQSVNGENLSSATGLRFYNQSKEYIGYASFSTSASIQNISITIGTGVTTTDLEPKYFRIRVGTSVLQTDSKYMISNSDDLTYEPYITPTSYQLSLGDIELNAIGDYKDELIYDVDEDKVYKNEKIGKVVLNGSEDWVSFAYGTNSWRLSNVISTNFNANEVLIMSRKFKGIPQANRDDNYAQIYIETSGTMFTIRNTTYTTKSEVQSSMNGEPLYYVLATPVEIPITDTTLINQVKALYNAHSNNGTTIITSNGNLPMIIKCRGLKGE